MAGWPPGTWWSAIVIASLAACSADNSAPHNRARTSGAATQRAPTDAPAANRSLKAPLPRIVIAMLDTGVDYNHVDQAANIWVNPTECNNNGLDNDNNGYVNDCHGINTITHTGDPMDDYFHGTHVAGTIGAVGNNAVGVTGIT